jgi:hypothetical protein
MNNGIFYILSAHPTYGEVVHRYEPNEMREIFLPAEFAELKAGRPVFKSGSIYINMVAAAQAQVEEALEA